MRLLLEGPRIEPLLARVRAEHGPTARIIHAERVRTGGVAGFFARERFEVTIEVDDVPAGPPATSAPPAAPHATSEQTVAPATTSSDASPATPATSEQTVAPATTSSDATGLAGPTALRGIDALVAAAEAAERAAVPSVAVPSVAVPAVAVPAVAVPPVTTVTTGDGTHRPVSTQSQGFADVLAALQDRAATSSPPAATSEQTVAPATTTSDAGPGPAVTSEQTVAPATTSSDARGVVRGFRDRLAAAGLPADLLAELAADAGPAELLDVLRTVPRAPRLPAPAGHLVAVVGERRGAMATARRFADRLKLDPAGVLVAGRPVDPTDHRPEPVGAGTVLTTAEQARQASAALRLADVPAVVVVECGHGADETAWAGQLLRALSPDQVVACVDATRKTADTRSWLDGWCRPGAQPDALSVYQASATGDPASVLDLDVPVAELDGQEASPTTWLATLLDRAQPRSVPGRGGGSREYPAAPRERVLADGVAR